MAEESNTIYKTISASLKDWYKDVSFFELLALLFIIIGALVIIGVFTVASLDPITHTGSKNILDYSEFLGGFVGSLWALAGVLLFYASLGSQKAELDDQRQLLVKQIDEIVKQTGESRKQNEMFKQQQVEETFFQMMRFQNEIVSTIILETSEMDFSSGTTIQKELTGRKTFVEFYDTFKRFYQDASERADSRSQNGDTIQKNVDSAYHHFYNEYQSELGHYFRNLINILIFINELGGKAKEFFLSLLLAQLSNYELGLLFFHGLAAPNKDVKDLLEKYGVLANVPNDELTQISYTLYKETAFGDGGFDLNKGISYSDDLSDNMPVMEEGFLTASAIMAEEIDENESWDIDSDTSEQDVMGSISDKLSALRPDTTDSSEWEDQTTSGGIPNTDPIDDNTLNPDKVPNEIIDEDPSSKEDATPDWSENMLSLDEVSTGWEDGGDDIISDETSSYSELEEKIEEYSITEGENLSKMSNLKEAFADLSDKVAKGNISDKEYDQLFFKDDRQGSSGLEDLYDDADKEEPNKKVQEHESTDSNDITTMDDTISEEPPTTESQNLDTKTKHQEKSLTPLSKRKDQTDTTKASNQKGLLSKLQKNR